MAQPQPALPQCRPPTRNLLRRQQDEEQVGAAVWGQRVAEAPLEYGIVCGQPNIKAELGTRAAHPAADQSTPLHRPACVYQHAHLSQAGPRPDNLILLPLPLTQGPAVAQLQHNPQLVAHAGAGRGVWVSGVQRAQAQRVRLLDDKRGSS